MADAKKKKTPKKPTVPFIGYGTNVAAGKKITKKIVKKVTTAPKKQATRIGTKAGLQGTAFAPRTAEQKAWRKMTEEFKTNNGFPKNQFQWDTLMAWSKAERSKYDMESQDRAAASRNAAARKKAKKK